MKNKKIISFILGTALILFSGSPAFCWMSSLLDYMVDNTVSHGDYEIVVNASEVSEDFHVSIDTVSNSMIDNANSKLYEFLYMFENKISEVMFYDSSLSTMTAVFGAGVKTKIYYDDADSNGIVDGTQIAVASLKTSVLNEISEEWETPFSAVNTEEKVVYFSTIYNINGTYSILGTLIPPTPTPDIQLTDTSDNVITSIDFGELEKGGVVISSFTIANANTGNISGSLSTEEGWIEITPATFDAASTDITIKAKSQWFQLHGEQTGTISITSDGGDTSLSITVSHIKPWYFTDIFNFMGCVPSMNNPDYQARE